jgi:2-amino-4-hydroxy-6-hydroxymethyldihydropteridine diphosphokinase
MEALIAIGANLGDRRHYIDAAIAKISDSCGTVLDKAEIYETAPVGEADQLFLNTAITIESKLSPQDLLTELLRIEKSLGRERLQHWGNRTIDLDIILLRDDTHQPILVNSEELTVPHPLCLERDFVLKPATDIASDWQHPLRGRSLGSVYGARV